MENKGTMTTEGDFLRAILKNPGDEVAVAAFSDWLEDHEQYERAAMVRGGVIKRFRVDFDSNGGALTLNAGDVCATREESGHHSRTHDSGWTISGEIHEDHYTWVNEFVATHPTFGRIEGDFGGVVFASSEEAFLDFWKHHEPGAWDYDDI